VDKPVGRLAGARRHRWVRRRDLFEPSAHHELAVVASVVDNAYLESRILQMRDGIERGESILRTAVATGVFNPVVLQMVAVGEETGELEKMLEVARAAGDRRGEGQACAELALVHYSTVSADHVPHTKRRAEEALATAQNEVETTPWSCSCWPLVRNQWPIPYCSRVSGTTTTAAMAIRVRQCRR